MNIKDFKNIAILQTAFIGDVVLTLPLAQIIRKFNPDCKITFITTPQSAGIPGVCAAIDEVGILDKRNEFRGIGGIFRFVKSIQNKGFDLWFCPHRSFRSSLISLLMNNTLKIGFQNSSLHNVYDYKAGYIIHFHEIERNLELLKPFGLESAIELKDVQTQISTEDTEITSRMIDKLNNYVVIAPGTVWETKKWKEEHFAKLINKFTEIGIDCVLTGSAADKSLCDRLSSKIGALSLAGMTNIPQTLRIIELSSLVITNDSAPTHFAGLMNTPVITIYGPTSPIFGFGPRSDFSLIIRNENLKCSPCRIHGSKKCPLGTHECMKSISPEMVFNSAKKILLQNSSQEPV
jgi:heptosyltransferase-2